MSPGPIVQYPDTRLRSRSDAVDSFDSNLQSHIDALRNTLYETSGIGLSAPQLGENKRVLVMDLSEDRSSFECYVNPMILKKSGLAFVQESCLSLPGIKANVIRAAQVTVRAQTASGDTFERELEGMYAVCLQHELDHLDGILFIDRISRLRALRFRRTLRALEQRKAADAEDRQASAVQQLTM